MATRCLLPLSPSRCTRPISAGLLERLNGAGSGLSWCCALGTGFDPDTLAYLDEFVRDQVIEALGPRATGEALGQLETDDAVEILAELDEAEQKAILESVPLLERAAIEQALAYPEYSAGRLMQREVGGGPRALERRPDRRLPARHRESAGRFLRHLPGRPALQGRGDVPLSRVLRSERSVAMTALKHKELRTFPAGPTRRRLRAPSTATRWFRPRWSTGRPPARRDHHRRRGRCDRGGGRGRHPQARRRFARTTPSSRSCRPA